jgi:hypothetical protein
VHGVVSILGANIDQTVQSVTRTYEDLGRVPSVTCWSNNDGIGATCPACRSIPPATNRSRRSLIDATPVAT